MRKMRIAAAGLVSAAAVGSVLMAAPASASAAATPSATARAAADTCDQAMAISSNWIWSLDAGIQPYADPRSQVDLLRLMARAYTGSAGYRALELANYVEFSCL